MSKNPSHLFKKIYEITPFFLKKGLEYTYRIVPFTFKKGKEFRRWKNFLEKSQWWTKTEIEEYQLTKLQFLLNHAYKNVPYYSRKFDELNINIKQIDDFYELEQIPILTKKELQENFEKLRAINTPMSDLEIITTGGTTGTPTPLYFNKNYINSIEDAFQWRYRNIIGVDYKDDYIILSGGITWDNNKNNDRWFKYNYPNRTLILSSYHLNQKYLPNYYNLLKNKNNPVITGYPSSISTVANFMKKNNLHLNNIKLIHTASENLYPNQKKIIEKYFNTKVFDHYGNTERNVFMHQCEQGDLYHIIPEYSITEILDSKNQKIKNMEDIGRVISTCLWNYSFPLIRYDTGDFVEISDRICKCGRNHKFVENILGRKQEFIVKKDKSIISLTAINFHDRDFSGIKNIRLIQEFPGFLIVELETRLEHFEEKSNIVRKYLKNKLGSSMEMEFRKIDSISLTKSGKKQWIIQKLNIDDYLI